MSYEIAKRAKINNVDAVTFRNTKIDDNLVISK
jgi:hypothetical protein